jgi:hypothetical protein
VFVPGTAASEGTYSTWKVYWFAPATGAHLQVIDPFDVGVGAQTDVGGSFGAGIAHCVTTGGIDPGITSTVAVDLPPGPVQLRS